MSLVRPVERADLPRVADLYERIGRSGGDSAPPGLAPSFARQQFDHPWFHPRVRSLLCESADGRIAGYLAVYARRVHLDGQQILTAASGPLVADSDAGVTAPGLLLTRAYLAGEQELSVTDGGNDVMRKLWVRVGGVRSALQSLGWTRIFSPLSYAAAVKAEREGASENRRVELAARLVDRGVRTAGKRWLHADVPDIAVEPLRAHHIVEHLPVLLPKLRLRPDYSDSYVRWLLDELATVESRGELSLRLVRDRRDRVLGWSIAYIPTGRIAQAVQVVAHPDHAGTVLDDLFHHAAQRGAAAVSGRIEPHLFDAINERPCLIRRSSAVLVHSKDPSLARLACSDDAFLSRLDGEWWMAPHRDHFRHTAETRALRAAS